MPVTFNDIVLTKDNMVNAADAVYNTLIRNLNQWYGMNYTNHTNHTEKDYFFYLTNLTPYMYNAKVYDFDIICNGYICVTKRNDSVVSVDASTDTTLKNVLTKGTADIGDDPAILEMLDVNRVSNLLLPLIVQFSTVES